MKTILIVEDSPVQLELLRRALESAHYQVITAVNGAQGLTMARQHHPAAIVTDLNMPVMDGFAMLQAIHSDESFDPTPIIMLTILSEPEDLLRGLNAGADGYLTKPYDVSTLVSRLESLLDNPPSPPPKTERRKAEVKLGDKSYLVDAHGPRILNLLMSTYQNQLLQNRTLIATQAELKDLNQHLEQKVLEKTAELRAHDIAERKRADHQINLHMAQLEAAFMQTVEVATSLSGMRDRYTAVHERRVANIATAIGTELGFDAQRQQGLRVAALLHDIGKMIIPAEILAKPGKLSVIEFQLIQGHAQASYEALKEVSFPWPVAEIVLQHHERMDGSGYPNGLKGESILLEARILAVADVVEAMSSHRPYRPGLGIDKALAEIERGSGIVYDPTVADACLKLFREKGYTIPS